MHRTEARVQFAALLVALLKAREFDAADALWEWAEEWLELNRPELAAAARGRCGVSIEEEMEIYDDTQRG